MNRPRGSAILGVAVAAVAAAAVVGAVVIARAAVTDRRLPPHRDQVELTEQPRSDPFFATAPIDGQLVLERCAPAGCGDAAVAEYLEGGVVSVMRLYRTPAVHSLDQLRQRYDQPATAGGWSLDFTDSYSRAGFSLAKLIYCRKTGQEMWYASVWASTSLTDGADPEAQPVMGVEVTMSAGPLVGSTCGIENRTDGSDTADDGPVGPTDGPVAR
jgi:hypothetical protein